jgi:hypothetical protein
MPARKPQHDCIALDAPGPVLYCFIHQHPAVAIGKIIHGWNAYNDSSLLLPGMRKIFRSTHAYIIPATQEKNKPCLSRSITYW